MGSFWFLETSSCGLTNNGLPVLFYYFWGLPPCGLIIMGPPSFYVSCLVSHLFLLDWRQPPAFILSTFYMFHALFLIFFLTITTTKLNNNNNKYARRRLWTLDTGTNTGNIVATAQAQATTIASTFSTTTTSSTSSSSRSNAATTISSSQQVSCQQTTSSQIDYDDDAKDDGGV